MGQGVLELGGGGGGEFNSMPSLIVPGLEWHNGVSSPFIHAGSHNLVEKIKYIPK